MLCTAAAEAGAAFVAPLRLEDSSSRMASSAGRVFRHGEDGAEVEMRADLTLLATGAPAPPSNWPDLCERSSLPASPCAPPYYASRQMAREIDSPVHLFDHGIVPGYG